MPQKSPGTLFNKNVKPDPAGTIDYSDQDIETRGKMQRGFLFMPVRPDINPLAPDSSTRMARNKAAF
jgi:hypothetical protein